MEILREVSNAYQVPGEARRRWFFSHEMDVLVWFDEDDNPIGFELGYGKYRDERAIRWKTTLGFAHYRVDDGEGLGLGSGSPLLVADGVFDAARVLKRFGELSTEVPSEIAEFVCVCLRKHPEYREDK